MSAVSGFISAVFWGVLVLSCLVFIHEGGHFLAARAFGMRVTEFFLGLPCRFRLSFKSKRFGTEFGVTPLLLGGYNRICGMEGEYDELLPRSLQIVQREGRVPATALASELQIEEGRAYALLAYLADLGAIRPYYDKSKGETPWQSEWPEQFETLQRDAKLLTEYDSAHDFTSKGTTDAGCPRPVEDAEEFYRGEASHTYRGKGFFQRLVVLVAGPAVNILAAFLLIVGSLMIGGVEVNTNSNVLGGVAPGSYAEAAGIKQGDKIVMLAGKQVSNWDDLCVAIDAALEAGQDFMVAYERDGQTFEATVDLPEGEHVEIFGVNAQIELYRPNFLEAAGFALSYIGLVAGAVARIIMPQHTMEVVSQSSSIVGISAMASEAASSGPNHLVMFAAAISMSLGFMNLLPIPPLDGGKILLEVIEAIRRKPLSTKAQAYISYVGLAFFLFLFVFAVRNDIMRIFGLM
ncbi:MAG: site-2 protease family protein [Atopobiaceae bacterium]|nr:site-2 protease family protein [Atopobiaceae bacterium]